MWWSFKPYESVATRRAKAERKVKALLKKGQALSPVKLAGRKITTTFWGNAWCKHLESYSDFDNRLGRGRSYVRNGLVIDLQIKAGSVTALVSGSDLYKINIELNPLKKQLWNAVKAQCSGRIGSLVDLLQGKLSPDVMNVVTARDSGLFPQPKEIGMKCSCPDYADLCKHLAAVLYGIGARFDERPELFFQLRQVDHLELITAASQRVKAKTSQAKNTLADDSLAEIFGIELTDSSSEPAGPLAEASTLMPRGAKVAGKRPPRTPSKRGKPRDNQAVEEPQARLVRSAKKSKPLARTKSTQSPTAKRRIAGGKVAVRKHSSSPARTVKSRRRSEA